MSRRYLELMFTPQVKAAQSEQGSRGAYSRLEAAGSTQSDPLGAVETAFIEARDSFYLATISETGWPYIQHRGGPPGFLKVLDEHSLGFADYRGNRQYISVSNLATNDRVSLFLMDYPNQRRLKLLGHARTIDTIHEPNLLARLRDPYSARIEGGVLISVEGFDWNCPQHITPRFTEDERTAHFGGRRS
jgi:predicted pyridoxine 5'-phosphate oxidase superfamily flavin-nucleotide-binding protein